MTQERLEEKRYDIATAILQGIIERTSGIANRLIDDIFYKKTAKEAVKYTDALIEELQRNDRKNS